MLNIGIFLNTYRGAHLPRRKEALRIFRAMAFTTEELLQLYRLSALYDGRSILARLLLREVRASIAKRQDLTWQQWYELCAEFGLRCKLGRQAQSRFFATLGSGASFEAWYKRWRYVTTRPSRYNDEVYALVPPAILKRLLAGMTKTARSLHDWSRVYDAPAAYRTAGPSFYSRKMSRSENTRRRAWSEIKRLLP